MKLSLIIIILMAPFMLLAQQYGSVPSPSSGNITMPLSEYNRLIDLASKPVVKPEAPPLSYAIKRADIKLKLGDDSLLGTVQCEGELFDKGIIRMPLVNAPPIFNITQAGKALPLEKDNGTSNVILSGPSEFSIVFDTGIPLITEPGKATFFLPVPSAGTAELTLDIPGEPANVSLSPGLITGRSSSNGRTLITATLVPGQQVKAWWPTREVAPPVAPREVKFLSDIKTLVSVGEADLKLTALATIVMVQGDPAQFEIMIPQGFEMTGVTGDSLDSETVKENSLILKLKNTTKRNHQFLISFEKPIAAAKAEVPFIGVKSTQRENGEILIEGEGTMELAATEGGGLKRIDIKEVNASLRSLARFPQHAAFRFHRQVNDLPTLSLAWNRFQDSSVLTAAAELAEVTTLITSEGRSLTEVKMVVKNQAKPFLKIGLPQGASILTAEVSGEKVKPVQGADGIRVPLLKPGFRPSGPYKVAFVFMHAGDPFNKKGNSDLSLPPMDIPISFLHWEVFLPDKYQVQNFGGNAAATDMLPPSAQASTPPPAYRPSPPAPAAPAYTYNGSSAASLGGTVMDASKAVMPGVTVTAINIDTNVETTTMTNSAGKYNFPALQSGLYKVRAEIPGFNKAVKTDVKLSVYGHYTVNFDMQVARSREAITVTSSMANQIIETSASTGTVLAPNAVAQLPLVSNDVLDLINVMGGTIRHDNPIFSNSDQSFAGVNSGNINLQRDGITVNEVRYASGNVAQAPKSAPGETPSNVASFQQRVAGVLPIQVDVPRAGTSYRFIRPLVIDEETNISFEYKSQSNGQPKSKSKSK